VVDSIGDRRLSGHALVESQSLNIDNDVKITLTFDAENIVNLLNLKIEFVNRSSAMGSREEVVITKMRAEPEPEFRSKGL